MNSTSSFALRARKFARSAAAATAAIGLCATLTLTDGSTASASDGELPVNALAAEITASADQAVAALDAYEASGDAADARTFAWHRAITARYTAQQLGYDELAMVDAWGSAPLDHQRAVLGALTQVGVPYRTNSSVEGEGFDCSGLTAYAWDGAGVELYRQSGSQISEAESVSRETAKAGDLVHYPGHVMLYLGVDDAIVHSVSTGRTVEIDTISASRRNTVSWGDPTA
ncbi:C40 family peptidase [Ilumatobacter coccineus]|uniref:NLP/P60 family protein n=1 Tax=Ilumatobacter coccineus (strain NBRC 103263 / KCTC 29153 / YM16-304) TaxID=1313172 RepID=A0A6C7E7L1_ILUCY|nr:NlpC/P60 family protein [Ilumatobacter coccineus]BAN03654.1 NLP/P60 family protein [Ilumatobacter coccineus YM16-304]